MKMGHRIILYSNHFLKYFQAFGITINTRVMSWKLNPFTTSDNNLSPTLGSFNNPKFGVKFNGSCLTTNKVFYS